MVNAYISRHPLEARLAATPGIRAVDHLEVPRRCAIATVMAKDGEERSTSTALASLGNVSLRFAGPGEWLAVSQSQASHAFQHRLSGLLAETAHVVDQSDGRILLRLSGPNVRRILAKGVGTDLHPSVFGLGAASNVLCGHISINLVRTGENEFELIVQRSFAESLFEDLMRMGREFDLSADFSD